MRRFFIGGALVSLCALPFALGRVEARGETSGGADAVRTVRTLARGFAAGGLATDSAGRVYFTANDRVYRVSRDVKIAADGRVDGGASIEAVAGTGVRGFAGDGGAAIAAELDLGARVQNANPAGGSEPSGCCTGVGTWPPHRYGIAAPALFREGDLAADPAGNLFVADAGNFAVRRVDAESQLIASVAGKWSTGTDADAAAIAKPTLVAADAVGDVFVAGADAIWLLDARGTASRIERLSDPVALAVSRDGEGVAVAVDGGAGLMLFGRAAGATQYRAGFWLSVRRASQANSAPSETDGETAPPVYRGLAIDGTGRVFVADTAHNRILVLSAYRSQWAMVPFAGNGHAGYAGDGGAPLEAELNAPGALALDRDGNLLIADTGNRAIREITHAAAVAGVTLSPNTFTFPNEPTGGASAAEVFTLTNNSSSQVTGIAIDFTGGATPPDFTETSACATTLDAGASCTISVVFMPQAAGERSAALHITDSDPSSPQTAALAGFADDYELGLQSGNTDTLTVIPGGTANYNLAVVPDATFSGTVTIDCPVNLPSETTCALAVGSSSSSSGGSSGATSLDLNVSPGAPQSFTMALVTTAKGPAGKSIAMERKWPQFPAPEPGISVLAAMIVGFVIWRGTAYRKGLKTLPYKGATEFLFVAIIIAFAAISCGGGGTPTLKTKPDPGTPTGTYTLNVRGLSQGASRAFTVTLIVTP